MLDTELAVLGLLAQGAEYAYEIEQQIRDRRLREWTAIGFSSIYHHLRRAERAGWVRSRTGAGKRGPRTRRYRLTAAGQRELQAAVLARWRLPTTPTSVELAMMFASLVPTPALVEALLEYGRQCHGAAEEARGRWQPLPETPYRPYQDAIFDHVISRLEVEAAWAERTAGLFRSLAQ